MTTLLMEPTADDIGGLPVGDVAKVLVNVSPKTVARMVDNGILRAFRTPGGRRIIYVDSLREFIGSDETLIQRLRDKLAARTK